MTHLNLSNIHKLFAYQRFFIALVFAPFLLQNVAYTQQNTRVVGIIQGAETQSALSYATVAWLVDSVVVKGGFADENGVFELELSEKSNGLLSVKYIGYEDKIFPIDAAAKELVDLGIISLQNQAVNLGGATVTGKKPPVTQSNGTTVLNVSESFLKESGNAMDVLKKAPGMTTDPDGNLIFRGTGGLLVEIDGKTTRLSGRDLSNFLNTLNSNEIDNIEILANPTASHDATGSAGIINIKTLKGKYFGVNGNVTGGLVFSRKWRYNLGGNFNYRPSSNTNIYGNYSFLDGRSKTFFDSERFIGNNGDVPTEFNQNTETQTDWLTHNGKIGIDRTINQSHTLGFQYSTYRNDSEDTNFSNTSILTPENKQDSSVVFNGINEIGWQQNNFNLYHKWTIDSLDATLETNLDYARYNNPSKAQMMSDFSNTNGPSFSDNRRNDNPSNIDIKAIKIDFSKPIGFGKFEAGTKLSFIETDNDYQNFQQIGEEWINDETQSNNFLFDEDIYAAYLGYSFPFKGLYLYGGLRSEYSLSTGNNVTIDSTFEREIWALFPSFSISKNGPKHTFNLSYSKRINRPDYQNLNPFDIYLDRYTSWRGNPELTQQMTHSLSFTHGYKYFLYSTVYYNYIDNMISSVAVQDDITGRLTTTSVNYGVFQNLGFNVSLNYSIVPQRWFTSTNLGLYFNWVTNQQEGIDQSRDIAGLQGYYLTSYHSFFLSKGFSIELTGAYNGPHESIWKSESTFIFDIGLKKQFANGSYLRLMLSDLFGPVRYKNRFEEQNVNYYNVYRPDSRRVGISFSYPLGKHTVEKANSDRTSGIEQEKERVKTE